MYFCKKQRNIQSNPLVLKLIRAGIIKIKAEAKYHVKILSNRMALNTLPFNLKLKFSGKSSLVKGDQAVMAFQIFYMPRN
jgi:hypothetical protein